MKKNEMTVGGLKPAPYNPRKISAEQMARLGKAMKEFGDLSGIVRNVRTGNLIGGHQRLKHFDPAWPIEKRAAQDAVGTVSIGSIRTPDFGEWVFREVDWPEDKEKLANIAANQHGGEFDMKPLAELLAELDTGAFDMDLTGFSGTEIENMLGKYIPGGPDDPKDDNFDADKAAAEIEKPFVRAGDIIHMNRHKVLCGDSDKDIEAVQRMMAGNRFDCMCTDPPCGVDYTDKNDCLNNERAGTKHRAIAGDELRGDNLQELLSGAFDIAGQVCRPGACAYVFHADVNTTQFRYAMQQAGFYVSQTLIWVKNSAVLSRNDYNRRHEPILYGWKHDGPHYFNQDFSQTTVIDDEQDVDQMKKADLIVLVKELKRYLTETVLREDRPTKNPLHPTMKPVPLIARLIRNSTKPSRESIVYDPFGESGTTIIACEQIGRTAYLVEKDPIYAQVEAQRYIEFKGSDAGVFIARGDKEIHWGDAK
jgi:DNA modification methylase